MRKILFAAALLAATACTKKHDQAPAAGAAPAAAVDQAKIPALTVDQVDQALASGQVTPVDCNGQATREHEGVLPGAVLLSDEETYQMSELPADKSKSLVFYCANTHCSASHQAAARAITAGYTNVKVMPDGIAGWVKAGKKIQNVRG